VILSVLGMMAAPAFSDKQKMMHKMAKYNLLERCWGEDLMTMWSLKLHKACEYCETVQSNTAFLPSPLAAADQLQALRGLLANPAFAQLLQSQTNRNSLGRKKRQANGLLNPTEEDKQEFYDDFMDFKHGMETKFGNLSCVLTQLEMLDAAGNINMEFFSYENSLKMMGNTPAGSDPVFLKKFVAGCDDCYDISRSFPQKALDRHPMHKEHGRHMIFFECMKKMEVKMCTKFQINQWLETMYGPLDKLPQELNLPVDKYDASAVALKTMYSAASDEMKFVDDFFWGPSKM